MFLTDNTPGSVSAVYRITSYNVCYTKLLRFDAVRNFIEKNYQQPLTRESVAAEFDAGVRAYGRGDRADQLPPVLAFSRESHLV